MRELQTETLRQSKEHEPESGTRERGRMTAWLKRIGVAGFLFFLIKGLVWLAVIFWGVSFCS